MTLNAGAAIWNRTIPGEAHGTLDPPTSEFDMLHACDGTPATGDGDFFDTDASLLNLGLRVDLPDCPTCAVMLDQLLSERP